ncbi:hypothetical protein AB833_19775 [Chromatiales bacterium (ex Bugula neritina AB1)]|nr:hypothetical protein AB833_19775 [Chromatiales bacterium (ex Bugula neritina AB1)]
MRLSTVKRESLIPPVYLVSIALLLAVSFIALLPSRDAFTYTAATTSPGNTPDIDNLDLAYIKARDAAGDLSSDEMRRVIHTMIRGQKWQQARALIEQRPEIVLSRTDQFLLRLETATAGFFDADNDARNATYEAALIRMMTQLLDSPSLQDIDTLKRASQISTELAQPELAASYHLLLANAEPQNAAHWLEQCARILSHHNMHGQSVQCYKGAIARSTDDQKIYQLKYHLASLYATTGDKLSVNAQLDQLVVTAPDNIEQLEKLASLALSSERPDLAYPLFARLSLLDEARAIMWLEKAARWAEASNFPGLAAEYVHNIANLSDETDSAPLAARRQRLLLAAGRNDDALQTVYERIAHQPDNPELLIEGITIASNMGLVAQAMEWNEILLSLRPEDTLAMQRQIDYSLAYRHLDDALTWVQRLVEVEPDNRAHRTKLAQLEEWNGNVRNAQKQRQWLADNFPEIKNEHELIRLAELNWDSGAAAAALQRLARHDPLSTENIQKLIRLYEQDGRPDNAALALQEMMGNTEQQAILLRELAALHKRHHKYKESLAAWEKFAERFGSSDEESINRMELHWRLQQPLDALTAAREINKQYLSNATEYQLKLLTELGWRYREPEISLAAAPYIDQLDLADEERLTLGRRTIQSLADQHRFNDAIERSEELWRSTGQLEFLLTAMEMALQENVYPHLERYLDANEDLLGLREIPAYWLTIADYHNRNADYPAALETYQNTLRMQPDSINAVAGLIWTLIGSDNGNIQLLAALEKHEATATGAPELWAPFAVGYTTAGQPDMSLRWFSKLMIRNDHDYNILLSFADALEQTGDPVHAFKVRNYALAKLRPLIADTTDPSADDLTRNYVDLLRTYGSASENEAWTQSLLDELPESSAQESSWRREMAASWYLATQRSDYARLLMTKAHERRIQSPAWQQLALALADNNIESISEILATGQRLSTGDRILALRTIGDDRKAFDLATSALAAGGSVADHSIAQKHIISLRSNRPGYYTGKMARREIGELDITQSGLSLRNTLSSRDLGFELDYSHNKLTSNLYRVDESDEDDIAVSAFFGDRLTGGSITTGVNSQSESDLNYATGRLHLSDLDGDHLLSTEIGINEIAGGSAEFRLGAKQDRAEVSYESSIGRSEYIKLIGKYNEISTRDNDTPVSRGLGASLELGTRGSFGSNSWTMGIIATGEKNDLQDELPASLRDLSSRSTFNNILATEKQELSVSASLSRGGINSDYPQTASPRYHLSARVGHNWESETTAFQVQAGAGFRVMGNDELSLELSHDRSVKTLSNDLPNSSIGFQYRNHF